MTSVTAVEVAPDLKTCKAYISVLGDDEALSQTIEGLKSAEGYIRRQLAQTINLRNTPDITFIIDQSIEYGVNMAHRIDEVTAADRAVQAGYDGVQIHAAHGFFLSRYISPAHNHRTNTPETLIIDIAKAIRADYPELHITMKINSNDFMYGGLDENGAMRICLACEPYLDSIEVSGNGTSVAGIKAGVNEAYFKDFALVLSSKVNIPVILVGGHRSIENMNNDRRNYRCYRR